MLSNFSMKDRGFCDMAKYLEESSSCPFLVTQSKIEVRAYFRTEEKYVNTRKCLKGFPVQLHP